MLARLFSPKPKLLCKERQDSDMCYDGKCGGCITCLEAQDYPRDVCADCRAALRDVGPLCRECESYCALVVAFEVGRKAGFEAAARVLIVEEP